MSIEVSAPSPRRRGSQATTQGACNGSCRSSLYTLRIRTGFSTHRPRASEAGGEHGRDNATLGNSRP
eukprot:2312273-Prymnesium_polylepis.2